MISRQRRACTCASSSHAPSGQIGAVPDTRTRSPTRTAQLKPIVGSKDEPDEISFRGAMTPPCLTREAGLVGRLAADGVAVGLAAAAVAGAALVGRGGFLGIQLRGDA